MPHTVHESPVTVILRDQNGQEATCSALLEQDPAYLSWNRMSLIGSRGDEMPVWQLDQGQVSWVLYENPKWPGAGAWPRTHGQAFIHRLGGAHGVALAEDGVRRFADLTVLEHSQTSATNEDQRLAAEYWFLQRPPDWYVRTRRLPLRSRPSRRGEWIALRPLGLRLRVAVWGKTLHDRRRSAETELISLPGIEIRPIGEDEPQAFSTAAASLWFMVRILITFWHRQFVSPVAEFLFDPAGFTDSPRSPLGRRRTSTVIAAEQR